MKRKVAMKKTKVMILILVMIVMMMMMMKIMLAIEEMLVLVIEQVKIMPVKAKRPVRLQQQVEREKMMKLTKKTRFQIQHLLLIKNKK